MGLLTRTTAGRLALGRPRLLAGVLVAAATYFALQPLGLAAHTRGIVAWDAGVSVFLVLTAVLFTTTPPAALPAAAERQQDGEWTIFFLTVGAIAASFAAILFEFSVAKDAPPGHKGPHLALVAFTLVASWLMTHVAFTIRYAHEYYETAPGGTGPDRGLEFPGNLPPDYWDFFYFGLVLGMTFQVSDVQITAPLLRRLATAHGFLGFLFNTVIIALSINLVAGLL